ncbi:MAG TPA: methyltransferase domain-containing protein [Rhizomicrobium sp.]
MDGVYRHQRHFYDLTRKYYLFGRDRLIRELDLAPGERLVEIGCGTARNLIRIARRYPQAQLFGLDASHEMLKTAQLAVARSGLTARIKLAWGYAEHLSPAMFGEALPFDRALFSYSLSMIPDWKQALNSANRVLSPAGRLHIVDFADLSGLGPLGARLLLAWLALFHVRPRAELIAQIEPKAEKNATNRGENPLLRMLPGRYAFLLNCSRKELEELALSDVAA